MGIERSTRASLFARFKSIMVGEPLSSEQLEHQRIPKWKALAVLSSDALSSVAYATEEVLIPLALFATAAMAWSLPIAVAVAVLLFILTMSYRQTIDAYPNGGGAYTVAKENLGTNAGLVAGAALLIDYTLTVAVSVAAGVANIAAAFPEIAAHREAAAVFVIGILMIFNLRGVRESASIFALPTYFFIFSFLILIGTATWKFMNGEAVAVHPVVHEVYPEIPLLLLLRAFSSGCAALTGIEAISNGIPIFQEPTRKNAKITMAWMAFILGGLFLGITILAHMYGVIPRADQTAISILAENVFGREGFYYVIQVSTALILLLAANTAYADFPRLASLLARDGFMPRQLASLGDRLVFSNGVLGLSLGAALLIVFFRGDTHMLIPLYAVGVFLSFTLSQSGMIILHLRFKQEGWQKAMAFNIIGVIATFVVLLVIAVTKFFGGAWMVILLIPCIVLLFKNIRIHYVFTAKKLQNATREEDGVIPVQRHTALVPVSGIHPGVLDAVRYALSISKDPRACYVEINRETSLKLQEQWKKTVPQIPLIILPSPYRSVIQPVLDYIDELQREIKDDVVTVIIPEFVTQRWYHKFLHNQTAILLYAALRGKKDIVVTSVRYHL